MPSTNDFRTDVQASGGWVCDDRWSFQLSHAPILDGAAGRHFTQDGPLASRRKGSLMIHLDETTEGSVIVSRPP